MSRKRERSSVPWLIPHEDINPADDGELSYVRDVRVAGCVERQLAMVVTGQYDRSLCLGLVALRCEKHGDAVVPLTLSIPDTPIASMPERKPAMNVALLSNPRRHDDEGD